MRTVGSCLAVVLLGVSVALAVEAGPRKTAAQLRPDDFGLAAARPVDEVTVTNFPATQNVAGTVNVGNLPLDADGAVRVTSAPARQMVWYELLDAPITLGSGQVVEVPTEVDADGFERVGVAFVEAGGASFDVELLAQWAPGEGFLRVVDSRAPDNFCHGSTDRRLICLNPGGKVKVRLSNPFGFAGTITSARVYLFP